MKCCKTTGALKQFGSGSVLDDPAAVNHQDSVCDCDG